MAQVILDQVTHLMLTCCKLGYFTKKLSPTIHNPSLTRRLAREAHNLTKQTKRIQTGHYANKTAKLERERFLVTFISTKVLVDTTRGSKTALNPTTPLSVSTKALVDTARGSSSALTAVCPARNRFLLKTIVCYLGWHTFQISEETTLQQL